VVLDKATSYVDAQEAARMLGVNKRAVRNLVARRRLESKRDGEGAAARLLVSVASLEKLRSER
jgi:DNA-directed RNA polymerase specialized sigma24 family protein